MSKLLNGTHICISINDEIVPRQTLLSISKGVYTVECLLVVNDCCVDGSCDNPSEITKEVNNIIDTISKTMNLKLLYKREGVIKSIEAKVVSSTFRFACEETASYVLEIKEL